MHCPFCGVDDTHVKDSRTSEDGATVKRRRYCIECSGRFTTFERVQPRELFVIKKNGEKKVFERDKILRSIRLATRKRGIEEEELELMANRITLSLEELGENIFSTETIGQLIMEELSKVDKIAYVRFASVYREFCEVNDFANFIKNLNKNKEE